MKEKYIIIKNPKENGGEKMKLWGKIESLAWNNHRFISFYNWSLDNEQDGYGYVNFEETTKRNRFDSDIIPENMGLEEFIKYYQSNKQF